MGLTFWKLPYSNIVGLCNWGPDPDDVGIYIYISNLQIDIDIVMAQTTFPNLIVSKFMSYMCTCQSQTN